jgi:HSP20 family protein
MGQQLTPRHNQGRSLTTRGQQYHPLDLFRREMDSLFNRFFGGGWLTPFEEDFRQVRGWGFDVEENDKEIVVRADVPGFEENELDVRLENDVLTIKAEKEQKGDKQREYRSFFRQVTLPPGIDAEKVRASYRNGVLELHIPRPEGSQAK